MRRLAVGIALCFAAISGGIVGAGTAHATDRPAADDWPVGQTYVRSTMYVDWIAVQYNRRWADGVTLASAGGCTSAATDDSCA
jgi:hypothetical protein